MAESDYLKIPITDTQSFRRLHRLRREFVLREVWDLAQLYQNEILQIEFEFPSVNEIADVVREKYG